MSKAQLKKYLIKLTKEQVIDVVLELYDARKEAKEYLDFYINPNDDAKLEEYKKIIYNEFYPNRGEPKCRFSVCRKAISDFKKLKPSPFCIADLMLFYIETGVNFTAEYGDMWEQYYTALENNFDKAMEFIYKNGYLEELRPRIEKMLKISEECGWGFPDTLYDFYYQYQQERIEKVAKLFAQSRNLATFVSELFDKDSANREQNKTCFNYAEVQPVLCKA